MPINLLSKYRVLAEWAVSIGIALALGAVVYGAGYRSAETKYRAEKAQLVADYQTAALQAEQAYAAKLAEAAAEKQKWFDFAQTQSQQLAEAARQLDARQGYLKQEIPHAVKRDAASGDACRPGLGADGLQLYRQALGYAPD